MLWWVWYTYIMSPEAWYTTIIAALSFAFVGMGVLTMVYIEDKGRYIPPVIAVVSILVTFVIERPELGFHLTQLAIVPLLSLIFFGIFFYAMLKHTKKASWY
jgi:uncharacterized membrane protein YoaK (UPF0700 family)